VGSSEHGEEPLDSMKDKEFLAYLSSCQCLQKDFHLWSWLNVHIFCINFILYSEATYGCQMAT